MQRSLFLIVATCWFAALQIVIATRCHFERFAEDVTTHAQPVNLAVGEVHLYEDEIMRVRIVCTAPPPGLDQRLTVVLAKFMVADPTQSELWQELGSFSALHEEPTFILKNIQQVSQLLVFDSIQLNAYVPVFLPTHPDSVYPRHPMDAAALRRITNTFLTIKQRQKTSAFDSVVRQIGSSSASNHVFPGQQAQIIVKPVITQIGNGWYQWNDRTTAEIERKRKSAPTKSWFSSKKKDESQVPQVLVEHVDPRSTEPFYIFTTEDYMVDWFRQLNEESPLILNNALIDSYESPDEPSAPAESHLTEATRDMPSASDWKGTAPTQSVAMTEDPRRLMPGTAPAAVAAATMNRRRSRSRSPTKTTYNAAPALPARPDVPSHLVTPVRQEPTAANSDVKTSHATGSGKRQMPI